MELVIIVILLVSVISLTAYFILKKKNNENYMSSIWSDPVKEDKESNKVMSLSNPYSPLTFDASLDSGVLMDRLRERQMDDVNHAFASMIGHNFQPDSGVRLVESVKAYDNMSKTVWKLSKEGQKLLNNGKAKHAVHKASGNLLPTIKKVNGKNYIEHIKGVSPSKLAKVTNVSLILVNTAHIISGADLARKMDQANKKLDELLAYRKIDRYSELEEIYYELVEINWKYLNKEETNKLTNLHQRIRQIRITMSRVTSIPHLSPLVFPTPGPIVFPRQGH